MIDAWMIGTAVVSFLALVAIMVTRNERREK